MTNDERRERRMKKKHDVWACAYYWTYDSGVAVLDPTEENYEDAFSEMCVKVITFHGAIYSRPTWHKLKENSKGELYFTKYRRRYYLKDMMRCNY